MRIATRDHSPPPPPPHTHIPISLPTVSVLLPLPQSLSISQSVTMTNPLQPSKIPQLAGYPCFATDRVQGERGKGKGDEMLQGDFRWCARTNGRLSEDADNGKDDRNEDKERDHEPKPLDCCDERHRPKIPCRHHHHRGAGNGCDRHQVLPGEHPQGQDKERQRHAPVDVPNIEELPAAHDRLPPHAWCCRRE